MCIKLASATDSKSLTCTFVKKLSTITDLPAELEGFRPNIRPDQLDMFDLILEEAKLGQYDDEKAVSITPKVDLMADLLMFPQLRSIRKKVEEGRYY